MRKNLMLVFVVSLFLIGYSQSSKAGIDVSISVPLPRLVITAPPAVVVIPGTYVYIAPDIGEDLFFYHDYWYRHYKGKWYRAKHYNANWGHIPSGKVPHPLLKLPPNYRHIPPGHERIPHDKVKKHWRTWENDRHWDKPAAKHVEKEQHKEIKEQTKGKHKEEKEKKKH